MVRVNEIETTKVITVGCCANCEHMFGYYEQPECREREEDVWYDNLCHMYRKRPAGFKQELE